MSRVNGRFEHLKFFLSNISGCDLGLSACLPSKQGFVALALDSFPPRVSKLPQSKHWQRIHPLVLEAYPQAHSQQLLDEQKILRGSSLLVHVFLCFCCCCTVSLHHLGPSSCPYLSPSPCPSPFPFPSLCPSLSTCLSPDLSRSLSINPTKQTNNPHTSQGESQAKQSGKFAN